MHKTARFAALFCTGGFAYNVIELLWRGHSHWSMFVVGGSCFHLIGKIGKKLRHKGFLAVAGVCSLTITLVEYLSGCVVNRWLKWNVWDYSRMFANIGGQVCLLYSVLWGFLSLPAVRLYAYLDGQISAKGHASQRGVRASQISRPNSTSR